MHRASRFTQQHQARCNISSGDRARKIFQPDFEVLQSVCPERFKVRVPAPEIEPLSHDGGGLYRGRLSTDAGKAGYRRERELQYVCQRQLMYESGKNEYQHESETEYRRELQYEREGEG